MFFFPFIFIRASDFFLLPSCDLFRHFNHDWATILRFKAFFLKEQSQLKVQCCLLKLSTMSHVLQLRCLTDVMTLIVNVRQFAEERSRDQDWEVSESISRWDYCDVFSFLCSQTHLTCVQLSEAVSTHVWLHRRPMDTQWNNTSLTLNWSHNTVKRKASIWTFTFRLCTLSYCREISRAHLQLNTTTNKSIIHSCFSTCWELNL